jgi:hypothetical protein
MWGKHTCMVKPTRQSIAEDASPIRWQHCVAWLCFGRLGALSSEGMHTEPVALLS